MKVSVIIPVYNGEKTIERCIKSVKKQTLFEIEIIVIDDGSTDSTLDILYQIPNITVIHQQNLGQGEARNAGMRASSGEYIAFVDADDIIKEDMLFAMYEKAVETNADIVQCNLTDIYPNGKTNVQLKRRKGLVKVRDSAKYTAKYLAPCIHSFEVCNKLFKREFIAENNLKFADTKKYFSEDILFNMEAVKHLKRIYFIDEPYYYYIQNPNGHLNSNPEERIIKMQRLFDDFSAELNGKMKSAIAYLESMVMLYNLGKCKKSVQCVKPKIKSALTAPCKLKQRLFLTAVLILPDGIGRRLAEIYAGR